MAASSPGRTHQEAGQREALEETGCRVRIGETLLAVMTERRNEACGKVQVQTNDCSRARVPKDTGRRLVTEEDVGDGLRNEWIPVKEAKTKLRECRLDTEFGRLVKEMESWLLEVFGNSFPLV